MRTLISSLVLILTVFYSFSLSAQDATIDSLYQVIETAQHDSVIISARKSIGYLLETSDPSLALEQYSKIQEICEQHLYDPELPAQGEEKIFYQKALSSSWFNTAGVHMGNIDYDLALEYYERAVNLDTELGDKEALSGDYNNIGLIYRGRGDLPKAIEYYELSLALDLEVGNLAGAAISADNIGKAYRDMGDYAEAKKNMEKGEQFAREAGDRGGVATALNSLGWIYEKVGDRAAAIENFTKSLQIYEEIDDKSGIAFTLNNIAMIYNNRKDFEGTLKHATRSLEIWEELGNKYNTAVLLNNIGQVYLDEGEVENAMEHFIRCLRISEESEMEGVLADALSNIGNVSKRQGEYEDALNYFTRSYNIYEKRGERESIPTVLVNIAQTYEGMGNYQTAIAYNEEALQIAKEIGRLDMIGAATQGLYGCYKETGDSDLALRMYEEYIDTRDTMESEANQRAVIQQEYKYEYEKQALADSVQFAQEQIVVQAKLKTEKQQKFFLLGGFGLALLFGGFIYNRFKVTQKQKGIIEEQKQIVESEKDKSESLLLNILPKDTADELKEKGSVAAKSYDMVSVLFTDIVQFTELSARMSPESLVEELNYCFSEFDRIIHKHGVEKIKTIGDAYMAAAGVPQASETHAEEAIRAALEINEFMLKYAMEKDNNGEPYFKIRLGVHSGPVVAGVVGTKKFQYDIWGDTVNIANRIESKGMPGKVNISQTTHDLLMLKKQNFAFEDRGRIPVKGKGEVGMYFVS